MKIFKFRTILLNFMMSGWPFQEDVFLTKKDNSSTKEESGSVFETKTNYINEVTGFLKEGVKQMKKDLSNF